MTIVPKISLTPLKSAEPGSLLKLDISEGSFLAFVLGRQLGKTSLVAIGLDENPTFQRLVLEVDPDVWNFGKDWLFEITSIGDQFVESREAANTPGLIALSPEGNPALSVNEGRFNDVIFWDLRAFEALPAVGYRTLTTGSWRIWASREKTCPGAAVPLFEAKQTINDK